MTSKTSPAEAGLRHPHEMTYFVLSVILNFALMGFAILLVVHPPPWLKNHPILGKEASLLRALALSALIGIPMAVLIRNRRRAFIVGNSIRLSSTQFPEVFAILEGYCARLGISQVPELYITDETIPQFSQAYSSFDEDYIVLHQILFEIDYAKALDIIAFTIAHELGAIRLKHTAWWSDILLTYVTALKWPANPLRRIRVYSRDRYGAYLYPNGLRGLLIYAAGRRLLKAMNFDDYLEQSRRYGGMWSVVTALSVRRPQVLLRIRELERAGMPLSLPQAT